MDFNASGSFNFHLILSDIFARFYMHLDRLTGIGKTPNQCNDQDETVDYTSGKLYVDPLPLEIEFYRVAA